MAAARRKQNASPKKRLRCRIGEDGLRCDLNEQHGERKIRNESIEPGCYVDLGQKVWHCPHIPALHGRVVDGIDNYQTDPKFGQGWAHVGNKKIPVAAFPVAVGRRTDSRGTKMTKKNPLTNLLNRFGFGRRERILPRTSSYPPCKVLNCPPGQHCKCTSRLGGGETCECVSDYAAVPGRATAQQALLAARARGAGPGTQFPLVTSVPAGQRTAGQHLAWSPIPPETRVQMAPFLRRVNPTAPQAIAWAPIPPEGRQRLPFRRANPSILFPILSKPGTRRGVGGSVPGPLIKGTGTPPPPPMVMQALAATRTYQAGHCYVTSNQPWEQNLPSFPASWQQIADRLTWNYDPCSESCPTGYYIYAQRYLRAGLTSESRVRVFCAPVGSSPPPPWDPRRLVDPGAPSDPPFPAPGGHELMHLSVQNGGRLSSGGRTPLGAFMRRGNPQHYGQPAFVPTPPRPTDPGSFVPTPLGPVDAGFQPGDDCCYDPNEGRLSCPSIPDIDGVSVQLVTEFTYQDGRRGASVTLPDGRGMRVPICRPPMDEPPPGFCCVDPQTMMIICETPSHPWHGVDVSTTGNCYVDENGEGQCAVIVGDQTLVLPVCDVPDDGPDPDPDPVECCYLKSTNQIVCDDPNHQWHLLEPPAGTVTTGIENGEEWAYILAGGDSHLRMPVCPEEDPEEVPFDCCYLKSTREIICADEEHAWHRLHVPDEMVNVITNPDGSETAVITIPGADVVTMIVCPEPEVDCPPGTYRDAGGRCVPPPGKECPPKFCPPTRKRRSYIFKNPAPVKKEKNACCDACASGEKKCCGDKH